MEGYKILADGYKSLVANGKISEEEAAKQIRIFEFLGDCDKSDLFSLVDSGAFNKIIENYCMEAMKEAGLSEKNKLAVIGELKSIFDLKKCSEL